MSISNKIKHKSMTPHSHFPIYITITKCVGKLPSMTLDHGESCLRSVWMR